MKKKLSFIICLTLLLTLAFGTMGSYAATAAEKDADRLWTLYENASLTNDKLLAEAQKSLKKYPVAKNKSSVELIAISGLCYLNLNKFKEAEAAGLQVIKYDSKYVMGPYLVGSAQVALKKYPSAEKYLLKAVSMDQAFSGPYVDLGEIKVKTKKYSAAAKYYIQSAMLNPDLNIESIRGYMTDVEYVNPMLAFKLKTTKKDTYLDATEFLDAAVTSYDADPEGMLKTPGAYLANLNQVANQLFINEGTPDEATINIDAIVYDKASDMASSTDTAQMYIDNVDKNKSTDISSIRTIVIGGETFATYTSTETPEDTTYKSQTYVLAKDGVVTTFTIFAPTDASFAAAQKTIMTYTRLK